MVQLKVLSLSVIAGLLLTAFVTPAFRGLHRLGLGRAAASGITILGLLLGGVGLVAFLSGTTVTQWPQLQANVAEGIAQVRGWLSTGPRSRPSTARSAAPSCSPSDRCPGSVP